MKRKMPFIAALSILCWGCSSYDFSGDDIVGVLQTHCQTDQTIREAGGLDLFFCAHGVRHGSRMLNECFAVAETDGQRAQMHVVEHFLASSKLPISKETTPPNRVISRVATA